MHRDVTLQTSTIDWRPWMGAWALRSESTWCVPRYVNTRRSPALTTTFEGPGCPDGVWRSTTGRQLRTNSRQ